jgi:hypothetical protein
MKQYVTIGIAVLAGTALFEVALIDTRRIDRERWADVVDGRMIDRLSANRPESHPPLLANGWQSELKRSFQGPRLARRSPRPSPFD